MLLAGEIFSVKSLHHSYREAFADKLAVCITSSITLLRVKIRILIKLAYLRLCTAKDLILPRNIWHKLQATVRHLWVDLVLVPGWWEGPLLDAEAQPQGVFLEKAQAFKEKMQAAGEEAVHLKEMLPSKSCVFPFFPLFIPIFKKTISF